MSAEYEWSFFIDSSWTGSAKTTCSTVPWVSICSLLLLDTVILIYPLTPSFVAFELIVPILWPRMARNFYPPFSSHHIVKARFFSVPEGYQALPSEKDKRDALLKQHSSLLPYNESQGSSGYPKWTSQSTWSIWTSASLLAYCLLMLKYKYNIEWFVSLDALMLRVGASVSVKVRLHLCQPFEPPHRQGATVIKNIYWRIV